MASTPSSPSSSVRVTVTVTPEVYETYKRLAVAGKMSLSRAMGEWLGDTIEAAEFMATKMEQARAAPQVVMREMHAYALGLADETETLIQNMRNKGAEDRARASEARTLGSRTPSPPSGNTGGKGPKAGKVRPSSENKLLDLVKDIPPTPPAENMLLKLSQKRSK